MIFFLYDNNNPFFLAVTFILVILFALFEAKTFIYDCRIKEKQNKFYTASLVLSIVYYFAVIISNDRAYTGIVLYLFRYLFLLVAYSVLSWKMHPFYKTFFSLILIFILVGGLNFVINAIYVLLIG